MGDERREGAAVRRATLAMAAAAATTLEQAVLEPGQSRQVALAWTAALSIAPALACGWALARRAGSGRPGPRRVETLLPLALFALPFVVSALRYATTGHGAMAEIVLLKAVRNLGLGLAATAHLRLHARLAAVVSLFVVTTATPVGGAAGASVLVPVSVFAAAGTAWLLLVY